MNRICKQCVQWNPASGYCPKKGYEVDEDQAACACFNAVPPSRNLPADQASSLPKAPASVALKEKTCQKCGRTLPVDQFAKSVMSADGYLNTCKACRAANISKAMKRVHNRKKASEVKQGGVNPEPASPAPKAPAPSLASSTVTKVDTLRSISDAALLEELKNRGFTGRIIRMVEYNI